MRWTRAVARALQLIVVVVGGLVGVARAARAQEIACDPGDLEVHRLTFRGNKAFTGTDLGARIVTTPSNWARRTLRIVGTRHCVTRLDLSQDSLRLILFYRRHGYSQVRVALQSDTVGRGTPPEIDVRFTLTEGLPVRIDSLAITGLDSVPARSRERVLGNLPVSRGSLFDQYAVDTARFLIVRRLRDDGYPEADALRQTESDTVKRTATVEFDVLTGPRARIGKVTVIDQPRAEGEPRGVQDADVRRVIGVREGDLYRQVQLEAAKRSLYLSEAFRHVEIEPDTTTIGAAGDSTIDIKVTLAESYLRSARTQVGWGNLDCARTQVDYSNYNFLGGMRRLDLTARLSKIGIGRPLDVNDGAICSRARDDPFSDTLNYYASASLRSPRLFHWDVQPTFSLYTERRSEFKAFLRTTPIGGVASFARQTRPTLPMTFTYQLEYGRTSAQPALFCAVFNVCDADDRDKLSQYRRLATVGWRVTRNHADDALNPSRGSLASLELRHASKYVGSQSDVEFNKAVGDASWYMPIGAGNTLAARLRFGAVVGLGTSAGVNQFIPPQERLYAGGASSVRGFRQNELGPAVYVITPTDSSVRAFDTVSVLGVTTFRARGDIKKDVRVVPTGGNTVFVGNLELRLRSPVLPQFVQFTLFTDAGALWNRGRDEETVDLNAVKITPGAGVRVFSLIGPIRMDIGYNPYDRPSGALYFDGSRFTSKDAKVAPLYCVSPNNKLPVTLVPGGPATQASGACDPTYALPTDTGFFRRLTFHFSIGQAF